MTNEEYHIKRELLSQMCKTLAKEKIFDSVSAVNGNNVPPDARHSLNKWPAGMPYFSVKTNGYKYFVFLHENNMNIVNDFGIAEQFSLLNPTCIDEIMTKLRGFIHD